MTHMILTNYHSHCNLCDGKGDAEEYVKEAIAKRFSAYGFSSHAPLPFDNPWTLPMGALHQYIQTIHDLKKKYSSQIEIYVGLEIDYIPNIMGPSDKRFTDAKLDYTIGSVHMLKHDATGKFLGVDGPEDEFTALLQEQFKGDMRAMIKNYYQAVNELLDRHSFDIIGHIDLIKKKNKDKRYFDDEEDWYKQIARETIELAAEKGVIIELNSGGIARGATKELYPANWMIQECVEKNIPMMINADSHSPGAIDFYFNEARDVLKSSGCQEVSVLLNGTWQQTPLD